ncbi:MAG: ABC transporter permease, partial [Spirochaetaceae bacterium]|nr:ABC transporter permease [Spirochaetaceae bacterium]
MLDIIVSVLTRTIIAGTPLLLATLGEIISERGGIMNLGIEGMMSFGAVTAFIVTFTTGSPWLGMLAA